MRALLLLTAVSATLAMNIVINAPILLDRLGLQMPKGVYPRKEGGYQRGGEKLHQTAMERGIKWPEDLVKLLELFESLFKREGIQDARKLAQLAAIEFSWYCGGRQIYIPSGDHLKTAIKHNEIYLRKPREKASDLAEEFGVTERQIYRIVKEQHDWRRKQGIQTHEQ